MYSFIDIWTGPRIRAPLGAKTTNAKAKVFQTPAVPVPEKGTDKIQQQVSARRPKRIDHPVAVKLEVYGSESPLVERDVEYAPPKPKDIPYESDDFPLGCLNYEPIRKGNLTKGIHQSYNKKLDENGRSKLDIQLEEAYVKSSKAIDDAVLKSMEEDWTVEDVPETFTSLQKASVKAIRGDADPSSAPYTKRYKAPPTIASRKAASALSGAPVPRSALARTTQPNTARSLLSRSKPSAPLLSSQPSTTRHIAAIAASRSTIGYTKGKSASGALQVQKRPGGMTRSVSNISQESDITITPTRFAQSEGDKDSKKFEWLAAFETNASIDDGLESSHSPDYKTLEEDEEEFVMTLDLKD